MINASFYFSTEQSSPSTLSTSSNSGRRIPRTSRLIHPHTKLNGNRLNRFRQNRNQASKPQNPSLNGSGGMIMLKNGIVLAPSQLMVLKDGHHNGNISNFSKSDNPNNQLTVVVVEKRSSETCRKNEDLKIKRSENMSKLEDKYSETSTPANSTSSSSSSSPSNIRFSATSKSNAIQNNVWCDKLHR